MLFKLVLTTIILLVLDGIWLTLIAKNLYISHLEPLLRMNNGSLSPNWWAAILAYAVLVAGVFIFAVEKANSNAIDAFIWGATFGAITYAAYDFTNLALIKDWSLTVSLIDIAWGAILCGSTAFLTVFVISKSY